MLGDEATTAEGDGELGARGGEAHITGDGVHQAQPGAGPVDRGDDRLGYRYRVSGVPVVALGTASAAT